MEDNKWHVNLVRSPLGRWQLGQQSRWNDNIKIDLRRKVGGTIWIELLQNGTIGLHLVSSVLCSHISQSGRAHKFDLETGVNKFLASN
jgi:hypothetical protein